MRGLEGVLSGHIGVFAVFAFSVPFWMHLSKIRPADERKQLSVATTRRLRMSRNSWTLKCALDTCLANI